MHINHFSFADQDDVALNNLMPLSTYSPCILIAAGLPGGAELAHLCGCCGPGNAINQVCCSWHCFQWQGKLELRGKVVPVMAHPFLELLPPPKLPWGVCFYRTALCDLLPSNTLLFCPTPNNHPLRTGIESFPPNATPPPRGQPDSVEWGGEGLLLLLQL